jgi:hypothetical protein
MERVTIDLADVSRRIPPVMAGAVLTEKPFLYGRDAGRWLREALSDILFSDDTDVLYRLDFSGLAAVDYSAADEMLGKLLPRLVADEFGGKYLCLAGLTPAQMENVSVALERRGLAVAAEARRGGWTCLGKLNPWLRETFDMVYDHRSISARDLSERLRLALNNGSTRLIALYRSRLVTRRELLSPKGFRGYVYLSHNRGFGLGAD